MATISSHILDTVSGVSAAGIRTRLFRISDSQRDLIFDVYASDEGRITEIVDLSTEDAEHEYELVFSGADYYSAQPYPTQNNSCIKDVVLRFSITDPDKRYHMPIMLSPHSYSVWWSN